MISTLPRLCSWRCPVMELRPLPCHDPILEVDMIADDETWAGLAEWLLEQGESDRAVKAFHRVCWPSHLPRRDQAGATSDRNEARRAGVHRLGHDPDEDDAARGGLRSARARGGGADRAPAPPRARGARWAHDRARSPARADRSAGCRGGGTPSRGRTARSNHRPVATRWRTGRACSRGSRRSSADATGSATRSPSCPAPSSRLSASPHLAPAVVARMQHRVRRPCEILARS